MKFYIDDWYLTLMELFDEMYHNDSELIYTKKGMQCYKLYLYIYFFGSVTEDVFPYIFMNEKIVHEKSAGELRNIFVSRVGHWVKEGYLHRADKEGYVMTSKGIEKLFAFVCEYNPHGMAKIDFKEFKKQYSPKLTFLRHQTNIGLSVLQLSAMEQSSFLFEPKLDYSGNLLKKEYQNSRECLLIPDALMLFSAGEKIFVEADNCTERKNTSLVPKIGKYASLLALEPKESFDTTIHFSVWHKRMENEWESEFYGLQNVSELHYFIYEELNFDVTFYELTEILYEYSGGYKPAIQAAKYLKEIGEEGTCEYVSLNELKEAAERKHLYDWFDKYFVNRQRYIYQAVKRNTLFCAWLQKGARLVCLPVYTSKRILDCVYIGHVKKELIVSFLKSEGYLFDICEYLPEGKEFQDRSGEIYVFKNLFCLTSAESETKRYVAIENISDEYGGALRVRKYAGPRRRIDEELDVICLYNKGTMEDPMRLFDCSDSVKYHCHIQFASYEQFLGFED